MYENITDSLPFVYPDREEIKRAQAACCGRVCSECEAPAEYAWREREVDMSLILDLAIKNELSPAEQDIIKLCFFDGEGVVQAARRLGVSHSTASRNFERATAKLENLLKYVVMYQRNMTDSALVPAALARAAAISAARRCKAGNFAAALKNLRVANALSPGRVDELLSLRRGRCSELESGREPKIDELVSIAAFFGKSTDYMLKGAEIEQPENT